MSADDVALADAWCACALGRSISHEEHLRISFVLLQRHGRDEGRRAIIEQTRANCDALGVLDRYDDALTRRWADALADAVERSPARDADAFLLEHPELRRGDLLGLPAWKAATDDG
ncbi:MAG TPA: hypothetical protein VLW05_01275 [Gaiellaceae bacterium]|nr:hypothetical protein [Gaiellaceae bacterium]